MRLRKKIELMHGNFIKRHLFLNRINEKYRQERGCGLTDAKVRGATLKGSMKKNAG